MSEAIEGTVPGIGTEDRPESASRRRVIAMGGAAAAGALAMAGIGPGPARADDCVGLDLIKDAPVNAMLFLDPMDPDLGTALSDALEYAETEGFGVVLAPMGTYEVEELEVPARVRLTGEGPRTVLSCAGPASTAVILAGPGASLSDLRVVGDQAGPITGGPAGAVSVEAGSCSVRRVEVIDARKVGIQLNGQAQSATISECRVVNPGSHGILGRLDEETGEVAGVTIEGSEITVDSATAIGMAFERADGEDESVWTGGQISDNTITLPSASSLVGVFLGADQIGSVTRFVVSGNVIVGGLIGVYLHDAYSVSVIGNSISGFVAYGVGVQVDNEGQAGFDTVVGNVIEGSDDVVSYGGIILAGSGDDAVGMAVNGNSVRACRTGIVGSGSISATVTGNAVEASTGPGAYDADPGDDDSNGWAGIAWTPSGGLAGDVTVTGNQIDGKGALPVGIRLHNADAVAVNGNLVRDCLVEEEEIPRDVLIRMNNESLVDGHHETDGAIVGNEGYVHVSTDSGGAVGDLRVAHNRLAELPRVEAAASLLLEGLPEVVSVGGVPSTSITNVYHFDAGSSPVQKIYPGRRLTLRFEDEFTVVDGGNLKLDGDFETQAGSAMALVSDGTYWYEAARTP